MKGIEGLREFTPEDYPALGRLFAAVLPEYPGLGEEIRRDDGHIKPPALMRRWIVVRDDVAVAMADYHQHNRMYHPRKFFVEVNVHPDWRRRGLGQALHAFVLEQLAPLDPWMLRVESREDMADAVRLLRKHGYREVQRYEEWRLDLEALDLAPFRPWVDRAEAQGLRLASLRELEPLPGHRRLFHELREPLLADVPNVDPRTPAGFEEFEERYFSNPHYTPDGVILALHGDEWIGLSEMSLSEDPGALQIGLTAVRRDWRGRGVASAMKVRALDWARGSGRGEAVTWVEQGNNPMLGINRRLGFRPRPAWVTWEREQGGKVAAE